MNSEILDDIALEKICKERFNISLTIAEVIVRGMPTATAARATIFATSNRQVYVFISSQSSLVLDDVRKMIQRMQCEAEGFVTPHGEADYFDRIGREKFKVMFPGKHIIGEEDLRYYKNLAPYNPALVLLNKIKGEIRGYDAESRIWRKAKDYAYSKIKPS